MKPVRVAVVAVAIIALAACTSKTGGHRLSPNTTTPATNATPPTTSSATASSPPVNGTVSFQGVTVTGAADLTHEPRVTSTATTAPTELQYKDLVIGEGQPATSTSTVTVQYSGLLYLTGKAFDSTWSHGQPAHLPLTQVIPGFTQGIAGTGLVQPMKTGGRRIIIIPASLGYGAQPQTSIPANSPLVFVVDLTNVSAG